MIRSVLTAICTEPLIIGNIIYLNISQACQISHKLVNKYHNQTKQTVIRQKCINIDFIKMSRIKQP